MREDIHMDAYLSRPHKGGEETHEELVHWLSRQLARCVREPVVVRYPRDGEYAAFGFASGHPLCVRTDGAVRTASIPTIGRRHWSFDIVAGNIVEQEGSFIQLGFLMMMPIMTIRRHIHIGYDGVSDALSVLAGLTRMDTGAVTDVIRIGTSEVERLSVDAGLQRAKRDADERRTSMLKLQIKRLEALFLC